MPVEILEWSPTAPIINVRGLRRVSPRRKRVNFGDALGSIVARGVAARLGVTLDGPSQWRLLVVGSILHLARPGDVVWGTGVNGKVDPPVRIDPGEIDIRAVRGPRTRDLLLSRGFAVPSVFGDPALLLPVVDARFALSTTEKTRKIAVIPNLNDLPRYRGHDHLVSPLQDPLTVAREIARSEIVIGSSLHAMILADTLGVESRLVASDHEHPFKYLDYYEGTGRDAPAASANVEAALHERGAEPMIYDAEALEAAFPVDRLVEAGE